jgi:5-oxoprolinase (ATP-hydrolysing)
MGFILVANAQMARPIRTLSEGRGFETSAHNLASFGGAGGQHAVAIARGLGIRKVLIHRLSSVLSAYGIALADIIVENQLPDSAVFTDAETERLNLRLESLRKKGLEELVDQGFSPNEVIHECFLNMRYRGSDTTLMISEPRDSSSTFADGFIERHRLEFGFIQPRDIIVEDIRVRSIGRSIELAPASPFTHLAQLEPKEIKSTEVSRTQKVYFETTGWTTCPVYNLWDLQTGTKIPGPAVIIDKTQTIVVDDSSDATILPEHVYLEVTDSNRKKIGTDVVDPIALSVFGHRFMSVAEQVRPRFPTNQYLLTTEIDGPDNAEDVCIN